MAACSPKRAAALGAVELIAELGNPDIIGVGTGTTVAEFIREASPMLRTKKVLASSIDTELKLRSVGVAAITQVSGARPEVYVDGADEVDPNGALIKGGGGALLGEKILAYASRINIIIVDESKLVDKLGSKKPVPIEVVPHALTYVIDWITSLGYRAEPRISSGKAGPVVSDWGGVIVDVYTGPIDNPVIIDNKIRGIPGVVETGIFYKLTDFIIVGYEDCSWRIIKVGRSK